MTDHIQAAVEAAGIAYTGGTDAWGSADDVQRADVGVIIDAARPHIEAALIERMVADITLSGIERGASHVLFHCSEASLIRVLRSYHLPTTDTTTEGTES